MLLLVSSGTMKLPEILDPARRERDILSLIDAQAQQSLRCAEGLKRLITELSVGNAVSASVEQSSIGRAESEADRLDVDSSLKIAKGAFFGGMRQDFLLLIEQIDDIADAAWDASKLIISTPSPNGIVADFCGWKEVMGFLDTCISAIQEFISVLHLLPVDKKKIFDKIAEVRELEERADSFKSEALRKLLSADGAENTLQIIQLRDFLNVADNMADRSQDATQTILIMLAKGY